MVDGHQRPVVETSGSAETVGQLDEAECQALAAELGDNRGDLVEVLTWRSMSCRPSGPGRR
jgi:hypothetical protein